MYYWGVRSLSAWLSVFLFSFILVVFLWSPYLLDSVSIPLFIHILLCVDICMYCCSDFLFIIVIYVACSDYFRLSVYTWDIFLVYIVADSRSVSTQRIWEVERDRYSDTYMLVFLWQFSSQTCSNGKKDSANWVSLKRHYTCRRSWVWISSCPPAWARKNFKLNLHGVLRNILFNDSTSQHIEATKLD